MSEKGPMEKGQRWYLASGLCDFMHILATVLTHIMTAA
jgi:hypothetical protein